METDLLSSNEALLKRFRKGDKETLVLVWQAYYPLVLSVARKGFGPYRGFTSSSDIEDAISATFLAAFEERARLRYDGMTPYGSYLIGIGRNVMRRQMKKAAREPVLRPDAYRDEQTGELGPEEQILSREQNELLARFPSTLSDIEREVLQGYFRDGLSEERLAAATGRTRYRVRKTLHRVERKLKKYLRHYGLE